MDEIKKLEEEVLRANKEIEQLEKEKMRAELEMQQLRNEYKELTGEDPPSDIMGALEQLKEGMATLINAMKEDLRIAQEEIQEAKNAG